MPHPDRISDHRASLAREADLQAVAADRSYSHGLRLGRIIELTLASAEMEFLGVRPIDAICIAEGITESLWGELHLPDDFVDFGEVDRGICAASQRYAEALQARRVAA